MALLKSFKSIISVIKKEGLEIKEKVRLNSFNISTHNKILSLQVSLQAICGNDITVLNGSYICSESKVESYTFIGFNTLISKTQIGRYNSIASNVNIGHGEHPTNLVSTSTLFINDAYNTLTSKECIIENDVWIGVGSVIRRGVRVGNGAIVGANSYVNKDVPPFAIVVGSPAKIIRYRFDEKKIQKILDLRWWEYDFKEALNIINDF